MHLLKHVRLDGQVSQDLTGIWIWIMDCLRPVFGGNDSASKPDLWAGLGSENPLGSSIQAMDA